MSQTPHAQRRVLGGAVRELRKAKKIKQDTLAQAVGVHPAYLSNIESSKRQPSLDVMIKLAEALGVDLGDVTYMSVVYTLNEDAA